MLDMQAHMTHDEIMKLEAGRELDELVAERVMGWVKRGWDWQFTLPSYSTDIAAAWQVVEKMQAEYYWKIRSPFDNDEPCPWFAGLTPLGVTGWNGVPDFDAHAPTAPLAICRAALLAVMDKRP